MQLVHAVDGSSCIFELVQFLRLIFNQFGSFVSSFCGSVVVRTAVTQCN